MISVKQLNKRFGKIQALDNLNIAFGLSRSYALIGPNGSGKTTLIKSILGLVVPDSGVIEVAGENVHNRWAYREKIGYMPQIGRYPDNISIGKLFDMIRDIRQNPDNTDDELLETLGLKHIYHKRMHTLSGGTRQKVSAAIAFLFNPPVLILDEPTAGLDPLSVEILKEKIVHERSQGKLLLITSHIMSDLDDMCAELVYLYEGRMIFNDSIEQLKTLTGQERLGKAISALMNLQAISSTS